jgi:hypothetical protein
MQLLGRTPVLHRHEHLRRAVGVRRVHLTRTGSGGAKTTIARRPLAPDA